MIEPVLTLLLGILAIIAVNGYLGATLADIRAAAIASGHLHTLSLGAKGTSPSVVHVRDTLLEPAGRPVHEIARKAFVLNARTPVCEALARMRKESVQLAVVISEDRMRGVVTLADILKCVLPVAATQYLLSFYRCSQRLHLGSR